VLERVDHVGYLVRHLDHAILAFQSALGLSHVRRFERAQFCLLGAYLGNGPDPIELFTFTDGALLEARLGPLDANLDHVAYAVDDIDAAANQLIASGARFTGPDEREELMRPYELSGIRHLWTVPATTWGLRIQLVERSSARPT
jgi:catechol 2,3-dioxygenase-like lactoylglutathione lyase family enzyme